MQRSTLPRRTSLPATPLGPYEILALLRDVESQESFSVVGLGYFVTGRSIRNGGVVAYTETLAVIYRLIEA